MATPAERQIAQGSVNLANQKRSEIEQLELLIPQQIAAAKQALLERKRAEILEAEGDEAALQAEWKLYSEGDPANGIAPIVNDEAEVAAYQSINEARNAEGKPNIRNTVADWQQAEQIAAPYRQSVAESQFVESPEQAAARQEEEEFQSMQRASAAFQEQVVGGRQRQEEYDAKRALNVVNAAEEALAGGPEGVAAFAQQIQTINDPALAQETVDIARRAGVSFPNDIQVADQSGNVVTIESQPTGGAFFRNPGADESYTVEFNDGSRAVVGSAQEAQSALRSDDTTREMPDPAGYRDAIKMSAARFSQGDGQESIVMDTAAAPVAIPQQPQQEVQATDAPIAKTPSIFGEEREGFSLPAGLQEVEKVSTPAAENLLGRAQNVGAGILKFLTGNEVAPAVDFRETQGYQDRPRNLRRAGEAVGDFISGSFPGPEGRRGEILDSQISETMSKIKERGPASYAPGGVFYVDPREAPARTVPTQRLTAEELASMPARTVPTQRLTAAEFASMPARTVPTQRLTAEELANLR